jgi:uroporphyrin-III C-methyltransferase
LAIFLPFPMSDPTDTTIKPDAQTPSGTAPHEPAAAAGRGLRRWFGVAAIVALGAVALTGWQWHRSGVEINALKQELAKKLADTEAQTKEARLSAEKAREAMAETQAKLGMLESRLAESQSQQIALEALYQELSRNRDEWAYAEIEQSLLIASQQLQLAGNVKAALIGLQTADARLQRMERPQLTPLRKAINRDIERLKALPHVDITAISVRLDNLVAQVDGLPLAMEMRPPAEQPVAAGKEAEGSVWARFWRETWAEFKQLVRIQQMAKPDAPLLAPSQTFFLRENLKLRLIGARLALLGRDATAYKADLKAAGEWLNRYYDVRNNNVAHALATLRNLHEAEVSIEVPEISATLEAMRNYKPPRERPAR